MSLNRRQTSTTRPQYERQFAHCALEQFGLAGVVMRLLKYSNTALFRVAVANQRFVLRLHPPERMPAPVLRAELTWLTTLHRESTVWVPKPIAVPDGSYLVTCQLPQHADYRYGAESLIEYQKSLVGAQEVIQYYACVISYSAPDTTFAERLFSRMRDAKMRVWYAPHDLRGGERLVDQIDEVIRVFDKVVVILSEASLQSAWVATEIRKAFRAEQAQGTRKLFPIALVPYSTLETWECMEGGHDLADHVRALFIPDFTQWKNHDAFEAAFAKLLRDLRAGQAG